MKNRGLQGFSLLELLAVLVIVGSLSVFVLPHFNFSSHSSMTLATFSQAVKTARSVSLYSINGQEELVLFMQGNKISIRKNDIDISTLGISYPTSTGDATLQAPKSLVLRFNTLGETQTKELVFVAKAEEIRATIHSTGFLEQ